MGAMTGTSGERQTYDDRDAWDRPVQAFRYRESGPKNETENARVLCHGLGWRFNADDAVCENGGDLVAATIEDVAAAMVELSWIIPGGSGGWVTDHNPIPTFTSGAGWDSESGATRVRAVLDSDGRHQAWRNKARTPLV